MPQETKLPSEPAAGELLGAIEFPHIIVYQGGKERARYRMQGDEFTIGRQSDAGLPSIDFGRYTDGQKVSRRHAVIYQRDGRYWIEDVKSANHTWVNGEYLPPYKARELFDGDVISISGVADLAFELPPALAAAVEDAAGAAQA